MPTTPTTPKSHSRLKGQKLRFKINDIDYACDATSVKISSADSDEDTVTFCDAENGGDSYDYLLAFTAIQSLDADSLWSYIWDNTGKEIGFVMAPAGNDTASTAQPHFTGTVKVGKPGDIGGEASRDGSTWTFDAEWKITSGKPTKVTA